jgi:hypothetical protein
MKRNLFLFFTLLFVISFFSQPLTPVISQTSGEFYGFDYEYGLQTRNFTKSVSHSNSFSETESDTKTRTFTIDVPIRTGLEVVDIYWYRLINQSKEAPNSTWQQMGWVPQNWRGLQVDGYLSNGTGAWGAWFRYNGINKVNPWGPLTQAFWGLAGPAWSTAYTELLEISTNTIPMKDWLGTVHDTMQAKIYYIRYYSSTHELIFEEVLIPVYALVRVQTKLTQVDVSEESSVKASLSGQYNFSGTWTENLYGQHVSVKDSTNYWFDYFALISGNVEYEYSAGFTLEGSLSTNITRDVTFTGNASVVPESIRPVWLQSLRFVLAGSWDHYEEEDGTLYGQGAIQSMVQVLLTRASTDQSPNLAVWGNFNPGRVIGYKDIDGNELLTAYLNESYIATPDAIMAIGFPEGAHLEGNYYGNSVADAKLYTSLGDWIIADNESSITRTVNKVIDETWGYDPREPGSGPSDVGLTWNEPVEEGGKAIFSWETTYDDMPMTWWSRNESAVNVVKDDTDITYGYSLTIDPTNGEAILESTYEQTAIGDIRLKNMMNSQEMSMATYRRDYYLSMTQTTQDASGSFARPESQFDMTVAGQDLFSQNFGGSKEQYYLQNDPGTLYDSGTTVMNLITAEGFSGQPTNETKRNPYSSPISKRIAVALTQWSADTHTSGVSWIFRENLVITSYPTWNGEGIVHDPAYSAYYLGTEARTEGAIPGFSLIFSVIILVGMGPLLKKRKQ